MRINFIFVALFLLVSCSAEFKDNIEIDENSPSTTRGLVINQLSLDNMSSISTALFNVGLNTRPGTAITVTPNIVSNPAGSVSISPSYRVLNSVNWKNTSQNHFTISSVCDSNSVDSTFEISFSNSNDLKGNQYPNVISKVDSIFEDQNNFNFEKLNSTTIGGTITEANDVKISYTSTSTTEGGGSVNLAVVLCKQPTASTNIVTNSSDTTEGTVSPTSLTFTPSNWSTPQNIIVTGQDDQLVDTDITYQANFSAADYDSAIDPVILQNYDNETPQIVPNVTTLVGNVNEAGTATGNFTVSLSKEPVSDIVLDLSVNGDEAKLTVNSITFSPATYNIPVTVVVSGVDDSVSDGDQNFTITIQAVSGVGYINASPVYITGTNVDND